MSTSASLELHVLATVAVVAGCSTVWVDPAEDGQEGGSDFGGATSSAPIAGAAATGGGGAGGAGGAGGCPGDWLHILGGTGANWLQSQAIGPDGSVAVTINNTSDLSVDGVPLELDPGGMVVVKFGPSGEFAWARRFGQSSQGPGMPVAFDPAGNVVVGGIGFGGVDLGDIEANQEFAMGYVASFSPDGSPLWIQSWGVPIESGGLANMALDSAGNVYFQGALGYDDDIMDWGALSTGGVTFIGKILADGSPAWVRGFDGVLTERRGLATTPDGHVVIGESLELTGTFGDVELSTPGDFDALTVELDADGFVVDARQYGDDDLQRSGGFVIGPTGNRALTGITWGTIDFGAGPVTGPGADAVFLAGFDAAGQTTWTKTASNTYAPNAMAPTSDGGLALVVSSDVAAAFDCGTSEPGFVLAEVDALGSCFVDERIAHCSDDPYCEVYFGGVDVSPERSVVSGYFSGGLFLRDELLTADIWDGFVMSKGSCATP